MSQKTYPQEEKDELSEKQVFSIKESEIKVVSKQCDMGKHQFKKHSENEVFCPLCQSIYIIDPKKMKQYV